MGLMWVGLCALSFGGGILEGAVCGVVLLTGVSPTFVDRATQLGVIGDTSLPQAPKQVMKLSTIFFPPIVPLGLRALSLTHATAWHTCCGLGLKEMLRAVHLSHRCLSHHSGSLPLSKD